MPHYNVGQDLHRNGMRFVTRIHRMRMLGTLLCTLPIASVLLERSAPAADWWLLALNALLWPQMALWMGRRARDPVATEFRSLTMDSAFGGAWIAAMAVSAAPAVVFATLLGATTLTLGWRRHRAFHAWLLLVPGLVLVWVGAFTRLHDHSMTHVAVMTVGGLLLAAAHLVNLRLTHARSQSTTA